MKLHWNAALSSGTGILYNGEVVGWLLAAAGIFVVLILPGSALLAPQARRRRFDALEWLAEAGGLSISLLALAGLLFFLLKVELRAPLTGGLLALAAVLPAAGLLRESRRAVPVRISRRAWLLSAAALLAAGLLVAWRIYQARELAFPAWVDGVHHVLIVERILSGGGLPEQIYANIPVTFSYHFGFHTAAALFTAVSQADTVQAVLLFGQVLNAWAALSVYRLAKAAWGDWRIGLLAAALTGFAFHMPAYYVTWSRYTLLAGLVVLGPALARLLQAGREGDFDAAGGLSLAVLAAGLALTHYTALWLWGLFAVLWALLRLPGDLRPRPAAEGERPLPALQRLWRSPVVPAALSAVVGLLLASPWIERTLTALPSYINVQVVAPGADQSSYWSYVQYLLGPERNGVLLVLAAAGLVVALVGRPGKALPLWGLLLALLTLPWGVRFGPFRPDHYAILLFFPAAPLLASLLTALADALGQGIAARLRSPGAAARASAGLLLAAGLGLCAWGLLQTRVVVNPDTVLARAEERPALEWIARRTPPEARFFVNTAHWQYGVYRGVDAGYWISTLTGRWTVMPPALYGYGQREDWKAVSAAAEQAAAVRACDGRFWELVNEQGITHVYLRRGAGSLQPSALSGCRGVREVYRHGGVHIFEVSGSGG